MNENSNLTAEQWFALGERVPYDCRAKRILHPTDATDSPNIVHVFQRVVRDEPPSEKAVWTTFLPGFPDGSFGWAKVDRYLSGNGMAPKLHIEYVGQGDSDKPSKYPYGTMERADLVEAQWESKGIQSTFIVSFDYSSLVTLELLSRQQERMEGGTDLGFIIEGVLMVNGGYFADAHSHPMMTTPALRSPLGGMVTWFGQRSRFMARQLLKSMFSKEYQLSSAEFNEIYDAISRRNGFPFLYRFRV